MARIPRKIKDCASYIGRTDDYLQLVIVPPHGTRVGLSNQNVTDWHTLRVANDKEIVLWGSKTTKTPDVNALVAGNKNKFIKFAQPLLDIIASSPNATTTDASIFNIVLVRKTPSHSDTPIKASCNPKFTMLGGGMVNVKCQVIAGNERAKLADGADGVEVSYVIGDKNTKVPDPDKDTIQKTFSKASFVMNFGAANSGQILYIFVRWINSKNPNVAGPWCMVQIMPIL